MGRAARGQGVRVAAAAAPVPGPAAASWWPRAAADAYSRRVVLLKRVLPAVGLGLMLLVAAWPRVQRLLEDVRFALPLIDRRDARELRMINPRYAGIDRLNRPYVLTAAAGRQMPDRGDLMSLDRPRGQLILHGGAKVVLTAATGIYQTQSRLLDLFGDVILTHENGTRFVTQAAHLDLAGETGGGQDPVAGQGPSGDITAQGFRILDKGDTIVFTGRSHMLLKRLSTSRAGPAPPVLPAPVEQAAAQIAAAAPPATNTASAIAAPGPNSGRQAAANEPKPTAKQLPAAKQQRQMPAATDPEMRRHAG
jgi:lipopolysaccharide export system protein LptC